MRAEIAVTLVLLGALGAAACGDGDPAAQPAPRAAGCTPPAPGAYRVPVEDGRVPVLLHVPAVAAQGRRPVVVHLPGAGQDGLLAEAYTGESALADQEGFLVAYPTAAGQSPFWNVSGRAAGKPDDVAYLKQVIRRLSGRGICADPDHVFVTGASNGGGMTAALACAAPELLAAAAPVAGGYSSLPRCRSRTPLPLLEIHSLADPVVPYRGKGPDHAGAVATFLREWRARNGCADNAADRSEPADGGTDLKWDCDDAPVAHERLRDAPHGWPPSSTERTWAFMKAFRRAPAAPAPPASSSGAR
jgi:polyhydroxybutyrate depolymerase